MQLTTKTSIQLNLILILVIIHIISASIAEMKTFKRAQKNFKTNDAVYDHDNIERDNAYFFDYRVHGADKVHHGEPQYFGQSEYRNDGKVSLVIFYRHYRF